MSLTPGAKFFDVDGISDPSSDLPHMLPSAEQFAAACDTLGVTNEDQVVVYDGAGLFSAARGWWMFKVFGHDAVALLDGGMPAWETIDGAVDDAPVSLDDVAAGARAAGDAAASPSAPTQYVASLKPELVRSKDDVLAKCVGTDAAELLVAGGGRGRYTLSVHVDTQSSTHLKPQRITFLSLNASAQPDPTFCDIHA